MVSDTNYFPFVNRDISILVTSDIQFHEIEKLILSADNTILKTVKMFDLYQDNKIDKNKKSMSLRMKFQSNKKTLLAPPASPDSLIALLSTFVAPEGTHITI